MLYVNKKNNKAKNVPKLRTLNFLLAVFKKYEKIW